MMIQQGSAGLLLDPGLGKTSCTLAAFKILKEQGYVRRALIVAPLRPLYSTWRQEISKWSNFQDITMTLLHGKDKARNLHKETDLYGINPEGILWLLHKDHPERWAALKNIDMIVFDESTRFKDSSTKRFKTLRKFVEKIPRRYILTGTFSPNGIMDLFGQVFIMDSGNSLGRYITHYRNEYFYRPNPTVNYGWVPMEGAFDSIAGKIKPLCLQMSAEDHLDMPDLIVSNIEVDMPAAVMERYKEVEDDFITVLEGDKLLVADNAAIAGTKCRQIANGAVYINREHDYEVVHDEKLLALESLIEELAGSPLLLLYEYRHDMERILEKWPKISVIGGGTSALKAQQYVDDFNAGNIPVLLGHPASMGHGLNLQETCHHVCWFGITWNFEYYDQAIRRVYRQGQKNPVFVYHIMSRNTMDQTVLGVLRMKDRKQKDLFLALAREPSPC